MVFLIKYSCACFGVNKLSERICVFVWVSEHTAIISLYTIKWLVFIIETEIIYCAVRTGCV